METFDLDMERAGSIWKRFFRKYKNVCPIYMEKTGLVWKCFPELWKRLS